MSTLLRLTAAACLLPAITLAGDHPNVKLGLWEISHESRSTGQPPIPEEMLAKLPPEARARLEGSQHAREAIARSDKQCINEASLEHMFQDDEDSKSCTHTIVSQTATSMQMHLECKHAGAASSTGTFKWTLTTPEAMHGTMDVTMLAGSRTMSHHIELKGKWLGADCGSVKPHNKGE